MSNFNLLLCDNFNLFVFLFNFRCQETDEGEPAPIVQKILDILYATEVSLINYKLKKCILTSSPIILISQDGFAPPDLENEAEEEY